MLWREYKQQHPHGIGYTRFCSLYQNYCKTLDPVMRFIYKAGQKTFVDYSGLKMEWINLVSGEIHPAEIFVGCLGASNLIYVEATASQGLTDWIASHVRMFECFGGVTEMLIPDNLKSGVHKPHRWDPDLNPIYSSFGEHYGIAIIPARVVRPRDKAKVETAVQCVEREIIAPLRHQRFTNLFEINQAIAIKLDVLNNRPMQRIELSRKQQFEQFEKQALRPLPSYRFELQEWKKAKVHVDYHVCVLKHFYSVPYRFIGKRVDVCVTKSRIEVFYQSERIALHQRDNSPHRFTTLAEHMPTKHQRYQQALNDASMTSLLAWAKQIGPNTLACVNKFFEVRVFPQQAIRSILGLKRLAQRFGQERFENACQKTIELHRYRVQTVEAILKNDLDKKAQPEINTPSEKSECPEHFRGPDYYR